MRVLGVNTGTSVDGVDLCLVEWNLEDLSNYKIIRSASYPFDETIQQNIEKFINLQVATLEEISNLNFAYSKWLAGIINQFKNTKSPAVKARIIDYDDDGNPRPEIELIGMHGQTIYHGLNSTWQLGSGSIVAKLTDIDTFYDFRPADMALGGGGAPLTSYLDEKLIRNKHSSECIATLNIGGISNITVMQPGRFTIAYDIGPGNTLIDTLMKKLFHQNYDDGGAVAYSAKVNETFVESLISRTEYFAKPLPKTTGRELFNEKFADKLLDLGNKEIIISSASWLTVLTISRELSKYPLAKVYVSGGGRKNKYIMDNLKHLNPSIQFLSHEELNIDDQYKEAMLFSLLAFTSFYRIPNNVAGSTGASKATILGSLAYA